MLCFSKNNTDSVSVAPVRYPVVQISFKLHILNKRGWASEGGGGKEAEEQGRNSWTRMQASIPPSMLTCFRGEESARMSSPGLLSCYQHRAFQQHFSRVPTHLQQNHCNKLPQHLKLTPIKLKHWYKIQFQQLKRKNDSTCASIVWLIFLRSSPRSLMALKRHFHF